MFDLSASEDRASEIQWIVIAFENAYLEVEAHAYGFCDRIAEDFEEE